MNIAAYIKQIEQQQKELDALYHNAAVRYGLSDSVMWILYQIAAAKETVTQQDLCRQCFFAKQTVHSAVANLVQNGYVRLETIPKTRNQKRIVLTEKGQKLCHDTVDHLREAESRAYGKLTAEELQTYLQLNEKLTALLREEIEQPKIEQFKSKQQQTQIEQPAQAKGANDR